MAHCEFGYADHKRIPNGTKVEYKTMNGARVKGIIVSQGEAMFPGFQEMRVTSRNVPFYKCGMVVRVGTAYVTIRK